MIGNRAIYTTPEGHRATALCFDEVADLPVFDVEVVDADGEVVGYTPRIVGYFALADFALRRRWTIATDGSRV